MDLYERLAARDEKLVIIGLGYVGMPIAVSFSKRVQVIGFGIKQATKIVGDINNVH